MVLLSCTKNKEVHPELGDGNEEFLTVGSTTAHVEYTRADMAELQKVVFHYGLSGTQQFAFAEMAKKEEFFDLTLNDLVNDTLYYYYYEVFPNSGDALTTERKTFHTQSVDAPELPEPPTPPSDIPEGAINGLFTINENGDQVFFSQGNLQYQASTNTWRFAENQWNYVGGVDGGGNGYIMGNVYENGTQCDNGLISSTYNGWFDLFGWGTSGYNHRAQCYQPYSMTYGCPYPQDQFFNAYDNPSYNLYDESGKADWGYNAISNGGNTENQWRTPKTEEWEYLFSLRNTVSGIRFAKATIIYTPIVNEMCNGVLLLPDNWDASCYPLNAVNEREADYAENYISLSDWTNIVEANGAVFLPTTGSRWDNTVAYITWQGVYWSSTTIDWTGSYDYSARCLWFVTEDLTPQNGFSKSGGNAVRLVQDANK